MAEKKIIKKATAKSGAKSAKIKSEKTPEIIKAFAEISKIPRCSKNEKAIADFLAGWAEKNSFKCRKDEVGNIVIEVPATKGYEKSPVVVLQGHMDMVCEKTPESKHNFCKDPIEFVYEGDWLKAKDTTLGADNGIAIALAMVLATDEKAVHPPLELLFTVDEETGLTGANALKPGFIKGKILLNLDSEDEGVFTIGCAGGRDTKISLPLVYEDLNGNKTVLKIKAGGMAGGHSGVNINDQRANALKVLAQTLKKLSGLTEVNIQAISGGTAHNAIPRDAEAVIFINKKDKDQVQKKVQELEKIFKDEFINTDKELFLSATDFTELKDMRAMSADSTKRVIDLLIALPHGVAAMSTDMPGLVETSNNLASVRVEEGKLKIVTSQRSSVMSRLDALTERVEIIARLAGAEATSGSGYPAWKPNVKSPLLKQCIDLYKKLFKTEPKVEAIHAGLECGIIGDRNPGMDMISIGPTLKNPHSPDERLYLPSIDKFWIFLTKLLESIK